MRESMTLPLLNLFLILADLALCAAWFALRGGGM